MLGREELGAAVAFLLADQSSWVRRRVETFEVLDDTHVRRFVSLDFALPSMLTPGGQPLQPGDVPFVPLTMLRKEPMRNFDLRDEEGSAVPIHDHGTNAGVAGDALVALADAALDDGEPLAGLEPRIRAVPAGMPEASRMEMARWGQLAGSSHQRARWQALIERDAFWQFALSLVDSFVLLADLVVDPEEQRILKFAYDEPYEADEGLTWGQRREVSLGWRHKTIGFETPAVSAAGSYHFEVSAPPDLEIALAAFEFEPDTPALPEAARSKEVGPMQRAHLHVFGVPASFTASAFTYLRSDPNVLLRAALLTSALAFALLLVGRFQLTEFRTEQEAPATLLIVIPGLLAAYLVRPGEHALTTAILRGVRILVIVAAACALAGATLLAAEAGGSFVKIAWTALTVIAGLTTLSLIGSNWPKAVDFARRLSPFSGC